MEKNVFKKSLVIGIIILLFGAGVVPISGSIIEDRISTEQIVTKQVKTIYVDNSYPFPGNGTLEWPYCRIQYAINNASENDTILVFPGVGPYYENVIINKSYLILKGETPDAVIVDGGGIGSVMLVPHFKPENYTNIDISNFVIQNGVPSGINTMWCENIMIHECRIQNNAFGIHTWHASNIKIRNNIIMNNFWGILMEFTDNSQIYTNIIHNSTQYGIFLDTSDIIEVYDNDIRYNGIGIVPVREVDITVKNQIERNNFISNKIHATFKNCQNYWNANFWENPRPTFPSFRINRIKGVYQLEYLRIPIPSYQYDLNCAKQPYPIVPY